MFILGILEIVFLSIFAVALVISTALDRRGDTAEKWLVTVIGGIIIAIYVTIKVDLSNVWQSLMTLDVWLPVLGYIGIGLCVSVGEFLLMVRRTARYHAILWEKFVNLTSNRYVNGQGKMVNENWVKNTPAGFVYSNEQEPVTKVQTSYREVFQKAKGADATDDDRKVAKDLMMKYGDHRSVSTMGFEVNSCIVMKVNEETLAMEPVILRDRLAAQVFAWTILWPAYVVSLVLGDMITAIFQTLVDWFSDAARRVVRFIFKDSFKV